MRTNLTDQAAFVRLLLDNACPLTETDYHTKVFYIETHCVAWHVEAYKRDGEWVVLNMTSSPC